MDFHKIIYLQAGKNLGFKDIVRENALFEKFYSAQPGLCLPGEFQQMMETLKTDLPASFRITGTRCSEGDKLMSSLI